MTNPYETQLGQEDPLAVIAATPQKLESAIKALGPERVGKALAPGKWSPREILCHLADCEVVFAYRLRQTLAEKHHVIQPRPGPVGRSLRGLRCGRGPGGLLRRAQLERSADPGSRSIRAAEKSRSPGAG